MEDHQNSQTCMAKIGLLFLKDCGSMVINNCRTCGRPICRAHSIETTQGIVCPECAEKSHEYPRGQLRQNPGVQNVARRKTFYGNYGYMPYYYGNTHYYSDHDYQIFDDKEQVEMPPPEAEAFFAGDDDGMES